MTSGVISVTEGRKEGVSGNWDIFVTSFMNAPLTRGILKQVGLKERNMRNGMASKKIKW